jgi:ABC-2 type transport system permease protein
VLFGFFQEATGTAVGSVVGQEAIVRKTQFPRLVIPLATVLTALFNLATNLVVVLAFLLVAGVTPAWSWLLFPLVLAGLLAITVAVSAILAAVYPRFRDAAIIWAVASTALFYATPVIYPLDVVSPVLRHVIALNPLAVLLELARRWIIDPSAPGPAAAAGGDARLLVPAALLVLVCVAAAWIFRREAPRIAEEL